jgi:hypothetical protein
VPGNKQSSRRTGRGRVRSEAPGPYGCGPGILRAGLPARLAPGFGAGAGPRSHTPGTTPPRECLVGEPKALPFRTGHTAGNASAATHSGQSRAVRGPWHAGCMRNGDRPDGNGDPAAA